MNKLFLGLTILIIFTIAAVYTVLFTKTGNSFVASYIENKVNNEQNDIKFKINDFTLTFNTINFNATISDNSNIDISGDLALFATRVDLKYDIKIKELAKLERLLKQKLNGSFSTSGTIIGDSKFSEVKGISSLAQSQTTYDLVLEDFEAKKINFDISNAKIDKLLHILNQPIYADGILNINGNIEDARPETLSGIVKTQIKNGTTNNKVINTVFSQNLKKEIIFKSDSTTILSSNKAITNSKTSSTLANIDIKNAVFTFDDAAIDANYLLNIVDLSNLYDLTSTKMRGSILLKGNVKSENKSLQVTGNSKLLGGVLDFNFKNNDLHANIKDIQIKELTNMLYYPNVFDSTTALTLDYDILLKKGKLKGNLVKGHFLPNDFSSLLNQFAKFDITKEVYETVDINTNIDKLILSTDVKMKSKNTQIDIPRSILDLEKSLIDADIITKIKNAQFAINLKGKTTNPKISFDSKNLISNQIDKQIDKNKEKVKEKLNKVLKGKLGENGADEVLKNFKSLF